MSEIYDIKPQNGQEFLNRQGQSRDFLYNPKTKEVLIYTESEAGSPKEEKRHPFQEFLYALRDEDVKASTSEWIDLQNVLEKGEAESLDDFYVVSRALLVKDVTGYSKFDTVFGKIFYGIEPPEPEEDDDWCDDDYDEDEQEPPEQQEVKEQIGSQEIVEPGETEGQHGGDDVHKEIEESKSSGHESDVKWKEKAKKEGVIREGKGGYSARERVESRMYDPYDKDHTLNYEQMGRVLAKLTTIIEESTDVPTGKLDANRTVRSIAKNAGIPELVWQEELEDKPQVLLMFDVGGSTNEFRPIMEKLFAAAKDYLDDVDVYYFHNAIHGEVWPQKDGDWGNNFIPIEEILKKDPRTKVVIVGDAWMAEEELWNDKDWDGSDIKSGISSFKKVRDAFENIVWINPILEDEHDEWDNSGTIAAIKDVFPMYDLTLRGIEQATRKLMEE